MPDREKVIKGLEYCMGGCQVSCFKCPYREIGHQPPDCLDNCMILQDAVELLKEQEPIKPDKEKIMDCFSYFVEVYHCGKCGKDVTGCNYCPSCGRKVKWK